MPHSHNLRIFKAGEQSADDPLEFVMSTSSVDRMGDQVVQDWDLSEFVRNPIALYNHDSDQPIGSWENVRLEGGRLLGRLRLAAAGTSDLIDTIRALVSQRILRAVSVGFVPGKSEPLKGKGYRLSNNRLFECSLVSIPANAEALAVTRSLAPSVRRTLFAEPGEPSALSAAAQIAQSRASDRKSQRHLQRNTEMETLSERIEMKHGQIAELQAQMDDIEQRISAGEELDDDTLQNVKDLGEEIEQETKQLESLETIEKARTHQAAPARKPVARIVSRELRDPKARIDAVLCALYRGYTENRSPVDIARQDYRDASEVQMLVRAAVDPARTDVAGWSAELMQETWAALLGEIYDQTVYGRVPGQRLNFGRTGKINRPKNTGRGQLAGGFIAEGAPIPVKAGAYSSIDMTPKRMKVITTATDELLDRSNPSAGADMRMQLGMDTAEALDTLFLDANARDTVRPAGLQDPTETGAANINAATGTGTVADVIADITGVVERLNALNMGANGVWLMNRTRAFNLGYKQDAASGEFPFRAEVASGMLGGFPFIVSNNVPSDVVYFVDSNAMNFAAEMGPRIDISREATLHMEDTAPLDVGYDNVGTPTVAEPTKSMFQTESTAFRLVWGMDWRIVRTGGVQVLTGVAW